MGLPDFRNLTQNKDITPDWAKYMKEGEFISYKPSYKVRTYLDLFDKYVYPCEETGDMVYYVYDPIKHGMPADRKYPVLMWLHGASNSIDGINCIMCCGAEQYASPEHQKEMGGAYILVPLANEKRHPDGRIEGAWGTMSRDGKRDIYTEPVKAIIDRVCSEHEENIGKKFVMGASSGGYFTWHLLETYPDYFHAAIPISSMYIPNDKTLGTIEENGVNLLIAHGKHDEMALFEECITPRLERLEKLKNCICYFPEWIHNGDRGIASVYFGMEMGQHCMINHIQENLVFDDGTPCDERLPDGVTGWIRKICEQ